MSLSVSARLDHQRFRRTLTLGTAALLTLGCHGDFIAPVPLVLTTDSPSYVAAPGSVVWDAPTYSFRVVAVFTNTSDKVVGLSRCDAQSRVPTFGIGGGYSGAWACTATPPFRVAPGETRADTFHIHGPTAYDGVTKKPLGELFGEFRLSYQVHSCDAVSCAEIPAGYVLSNPFTVVRGQ